MDNLIEKIKGLDKKVLIGAGIGVVALIILIVALVIGLGGKKPAGGNTQENSQAGTESGSEVFSPEGTGTEADPFIMAGTEFDVTVPAEGLVYYQMYKVDGMVLTIEDENAYVKYGDKEYKAENGVVNVPLTTPDTYTPASFAIGNLAKEEKTFKVSLAFPQGTQGNPIVLELGDFNASVAAGNDQGVYYTYTATETGLLTVTLLSVTEGIQYDYTLYNLNTYAMRTMSTEGAENANGNKTVSVQVNAGDVVQISVGTLPNEQNEYPAGEFELSASFIAGEGAIDPNQKIEYSVTVKDEAGKALVGVTVNISGSGIENTVLTTDANGVAKTTLAAGTYTAIVSAPNGYKMDSTEYKLSPDKASVEVKLEKKSTVEKTYTVKVVNESNKAMSGVLVTVGDSFGNTDSNGNVSFKLLEDNYTATASCNGYKTTSKAFGNATSVTITMKKETVATNPNAKSYTVEVIDYAGHEYDRHADFGSLCVRNELQSTQLKVLDDGKVAFGAIYEDRHWVNETFKGNGIEWYWKASAIILDVEKGNIVASCSTARENVRHRTDPNLDLWNKIDNHDFMDFDGKTLKVALKNASTKQEYAKASVEVDFEKYNQNLENMLDEKNKEQITSSMQKVRKLLESKTGKSSTTNKDKKPVITNIVLANKGKSGYGD